MVTHHSELAEMMVCDGKKDSGMKTERCENSAIDVSGMHKHCNDAWYRNNIT